MGKGKIGIVTVLYKSDNVIADFFISIAKQEYTNFKIFIIDNSYSENSYNNMIQLLELHSLQKKFVYLNSHSNIGVAAGNNIGINYALQEDCEYVLLANNDVVFNQTNMFDGLVNKSKQNLIVAPKIYFYNTNLIWYLGGNFNIFKEVIHLNYRKNDVNLHKSDFITKYAPTCFVLIHKEIFNKIGLIDEQFFVYGDDSDFMWRAYKNNIQIKCTPEFFLYHKVSNSTGGRLSPFSTFYTIRNRLYFSKKNHKWYLFYFLFTYIFLVSFIKLIVYTKPNKIAIINAFKDFFKIKIEKLK